MRDKQSSRRSSPHGAAILVVDNDLALRDSLKLLLTLEGFAATAAAGIDAALTASQGRRIDCILSDYSLAAGETGTDVIERIRSQQGADIPALILTADRSQDRRDDAERLGCRLLHKPVDSETLLLTIYGLLVKNQPRQPS